MASLPSRERSMACEDDPMFLPDSSETSSHLALDVAGEKVKDLIKTINELQKLGIQKTSNLPLPKIVVVGDQSAGKSSLVEAISIIKVPRASGLCTRCPLEITLGPSTEWTGSISISQRYAKEADSKSKFTDGWLGPWSPLQHTQTIPFLERCSKEDLALALVRAQEAVVNPGLDPKLFAEGGTVTKMQCEFSPNVVCLEITGPKLYNLSFTDLPGVINQHDDKGLPTLVEHLVQEYIDDENTLILLACSLESDIANSTGAKLVRGANAEERTIGVLTKPDRLAAGSDHTQLRDVLRGRTFKLGHGYYVTKQPSQVDLADGIEHSEARLREESFFLKEGPWNTSSFMQFKNRFGTEHLRDQLSTLLGEQILRELPNITNQIQKKAAEVNGELSSLPEPPSDCFRTTIDILAKFKIAVSDSIKGEYPAHMFGSHWREIAKVYRVRMMSMRPTLEPLTDAEKLEQSQVNRPIALDDSDDDDAVAAAAASSPSNSRKRVKQEPVTPSKRRRGEASSSHTSAAATMGANFKLEVVYDAVDKARPGFSNLPTPKVIERLIKLSTRDWDKPLGDLFKSVSSLVREDLFSTLQILLRPWATTELSRIMKSTLKDFMTGALERLRKKLQKVLLYERDCSMTLDEDALDSHYRQELGILQGVRQKSRATLSIDVQESQAGRFTEGLKRTKKVEDLVLETDLYRREHEVMARVRAYYNVAASRIVDNVYQIVQAELLKYCVDELPGALEAAVGVDGSDASEKCQRLMAEDPEREVRRQELRLEMNELMQAKDRLDKLYAKHEF